MIPGHIENANLRLVGDLSEGMVDLHARVVMEDGYSLITSAWEPTPDELRRLNEGHPVYVTLLCASGFPPVRVEVKP